MAKVSAQPPRGTRDFLPGDVRRREHVIGIIRGVFERHGFEPLETPALERLDTLLGKYGDEGDQLLFKVLLRGAPLVKGIRQANAHVEGGGIVVGRSGETAPGAEPMLADLGLRYDLTVPLARAVAAHRGKLPAILKRYQIQPVWRADTPSKGRYREFYQCDVDVVGTRSPLAEAEVLGAVSAALGKLGFDDFTVRINHRQLLRAVCETAGVPKGREGDALVAIDKLDKIGTEGVVKELSERGFGDPQRILDIASDGDLDSLSRTLGGHAEGTAAIANLREVMALAANTPTGDRLRFDATLARGLGYYTGCIFEINVADLAGSLAGGGRYDGLVGSFGGSEAPACGFSIGLERILVVMDERNMYPDDLGGADVLLSAADAADRGAALALATHLRAAGLRVDLCPDALSPGKLRKQADARGLRAAVWLERDGGGRANAWLRAQGATHENLDGDALTKLLGAEGSRR